MIQGIALPLCAQAVNHLLGFFSIVPYVEIILENMRAKPHLVLLFFCNVYTFSSLSGLCVEGIDHVVQC